MIRLRRSGWVPRVTWRVGPLRWTVDIEGIRLWPLIEIHWPDLWTDPPRYAPMTPQEQWEADRWDR